MGEDGIALYDVNNDTCTIHKYPSNMRVEYHSYCEYKNYIYIINNDGTIIVFNIKTKQFQEIQNIKNKQVIGAYSACINIKGSDIIHIFGGLQNEYHIIYDIIKNEYVKKQDFRLNMENPSIIYLAQQRKIIIFCGYLFFIGHNYNISNEREWKWTTSNTLKIPNGIRDCGYILYGNQYLLLFGGCASNKTILNDIYLINLETNKIENKYKNIQCPKKDKYHCVLIQNRIHLFGLFNYTKHYSLPINKILNDNQLNINYNIKKEIIQIQMDENEEKKEEKKQEISAHSEEIINLKKQIQILEKENEILKKENKILKNENIKKEENKIDIEENNENMNVDINNEVVVWLTNSVKLPQYSDKFIKNGIDDLFVLQTMTEQDLENYVGIKIFGHRKKILIYIEKLNQNDNEGKIKHYQTALI